jgi:elongation factor Ts
MGISAADVKALRDMTGAGMMDCKRALEEAGGDREKAVDILRTRGAAKAAKRAERAAREGAIGSYIHMNARVGVLVEVNCETDFVARNEEFQVLVKDIAMHVAAMNPLAITPEEIPAAEVERWRAVFQEQVSAEGKPENIRARIVEGKIGKFYQENALLEQAFVKRPEITVREYVAEVAAKTGENVVVRRFMRYALGE